MATYVNNLRLMEIATGAESGTWGTKTNTNLELIADAFGSGTEAITTNANTHSTTVADGAADEGRAIYMKYTGALDSNCTISLLPNTINKFWLIENATTDSGSSGPYSIIISQGSGANITIGNGKVAAIFTDGAGGGAAVLDAFADLVVSDSFQVAGPNLTIGDAAAEDTKLLFDGNAQDFYIGLDDSVDDLVIGLGSVVGTTPAVTIDENQAVVFPAASVTVGDGTAEDTKLVYNGNAQDFYIGLDDSADDLVIGLGSTVGTTPAVTIDENQAVVFPAAAVTIGDGTAEDTKLVYNGNAQDFYIGLDDSADDLLIGVGSTVGTTPAITIDENADVAIADDLTLVSDAAVLNFGVNSDVSLTHVHDTGLLLNSTMQLQFNDASQYISGTSATVLSIAATDEIDLSATAVDLNGTLDVSGASTLTGNVTHSGQSTLTGTVGIGQAAGGQALGVLFATGDEYISDMVHSHASTPFGIRMRFTGGAPNDATQEFLKFTDSSATRAVLRSNGGLANFQSNNADLSDERLKTIHNPTESKWDAHAALSIIDYHYNDSPDTRLLIGVGAHQAGECDERLCNTDGWEEDGEKYHGVYSKDLSFYTMKTVQECQARIVALEAALAELQGA